MQMANKKNNNPSMASTRASTNARMTMQTARSSLDSAMPRSSVESSDSGPNYGVTASSPIRKNSSGGNLYLGYDPEQEKINQAGATGTMFDRKSRIGAVPDSQATGDAMRKRR